MRFLVAIAGIVLILFGGTYWVLFTKSGNEMLIPFIEKKASEAAKAPIKISIFRLTPSSLALDATYQESINIKVEGAIAILSKSFDLDYLVEADSLKTPQININEPISLKGNVKGDLKDINVKGIGVVFEAPASYDVQILNKNLSRAVIKVENLSIQKMQALVNQPVLAYGRGDLHVNIVQKDGVPFGSAKIEVFDGRLNEDAIFKQFSVKLPQNITYQANFDAVLRENRVDGKGVVDTSLGKLLLNNSVYELKTQKLESDFELLVPDLSALEELAGIALRGKLAAVGQVQGDKNGIQARARTESFGGKIEAIYQEDKAFVAGEDVRLDKILYALVQPPLASGEVNFDLKMDSLANKKGDLALTVLNGVLLQAGMKELTGLDWPQKTEFGLNSKALINDALIDYEATFKSSLADISGIKGVFDTKGLSTQTPFSLHVKELSDLAFVTSRPLKGPMQMDGTIKLANGSVNVHGETGLLDGKSTIDFENNQLLVDLKNFSMLRLSEVLDFPYVFEAIGEADAKYDVIQKQGEFSLLLPEGHLRQSELVSLVQALTGFDLIQETYTNSTLKGVIKNEMVGFDVTMEGEQSYLKVDQGVLNLEANSINAPFALKVENKDLSGVIKGGISKPKVSIKASEYIQKKITKELEKHVPEEAGDVVKELLKLF